MKKIITLALSLVLILTFMAGCGDAERLLYNVDLKDYKEIGIILDDVKKMVLNSKISNEKESILKYIKKHY